MYSTDSLLQLSPYRLQHRQFVEDHLPEVQDEYGEPNANDVASLKESEVTKLPRESICRVTGVGSLTSDESRLLSASPERVEYHLDEGARNKIAVSANCLYCPAISWRCICCFNTVLHSWPNGSITSIDSEMPFSKCGPPAQQSSLSSDVRAICSDTAIVRVDTIYRCFDLPMDQLIKFVLSWV